MNNTDTVSLREALQEFVDHHTKPAGLTLETVTDQKAFSDFIHKTEDKEKAMIAKAIAILAAPVAAIQPAGVACSACYGSGYGIDGKPCPCGCRPAASAPAQPEAKGEALHWLDSPQSALNGKTAREGYAANPEYAHLFADEPNLWKRLANRAVEVLNRHIVPDGISDNAALIELYGIFDGPEYRAALAAPVPAAPADKGELLKLVHPRSPGVEFCNDELRAIEAYGQACILADRARQLPRIRHLEHERDLARQAAIAQPSGAVLDGFELVTKEWADMARRTSCANFAAGVAAIANPWE